ncbi:MAG: HAMP domain-containing histidine kinase [Gemmatimonadetes bacterium]|nr:HAMP domain-containing histidine kinase [Gemmatimonadota bacterium]
MPAPSPSGPLAPLASRNTLLGVALAATLGLGGLFAVEAVQVSRSHQVSVGRFLDESAQAAAHEYLTRSRDELDAIAADLLSGLTGPRAPSPFEALPPIDNLQRAAERTFACPAGAVRAFRLDFRSDSLVTGTTTTPAERAALARRVRDDYRARFRPEWHAALLAGTGAPPLLYGVRFSEFRAPMAAFGVDVCPAALRDAIFARALARGGLLAAGPRNVPQDSLLAALVTDDAGTPLLGAADTSAALHRATATLERLGGIRATVTLKPAAAALIAVSPPSSSRVALLAGLFVLTVLLALVTLLQLRREAALVRLRTDFTSSVSHELRTPLAQILLFGETLRLGRARTEADRQVAVDTIVEEGRRLQHLVDNLLQFDRAQRGAAPLALATVSVRDTVRSACEAFAPIAGAAHLTVESTVPEGLTVRGDAAALRHVLLNFLDNAAKYGPASQVVRVDAERVSAENGRAHHAGAPHAAVRVRVTDQGPGVPADEREAIWSPFARLDRDRRGTRPGSGIGLSVVRDLVSRQDGRCWVEDAPGGGATFVVELPAAEGSA